MIERIQPDGLTKPHTYTHVIRASNNGTTVYVAGQTAVNARGEVVGHDITTQGRQVMENLKTALAAAGAGFEHLVKITIFLTDPRYREGLAEVRRVYLGDVVPTSTLLVVAGLGDPRFLVEIEAIAVIP